MHYLLDAQACLPGSLQLDSVSPVGERLVSQSVFQSLEAFLGPRKREQGFVTLKWTVSYVFTLHHTAGAGHRKHLAGMMAIIGCQPDYNQN